MHKVLTMKKSTLNLIILTLMCIAMCFISCSKEPMHELGAISVTIGNTTHNYTQDAVSISTTPCSQGNIYTIQAIEEGSMFIISIVSSSLSIGKYTCYYTYWGINDSSGQIVLDIQSNSHATFTGTATGSINFKIIS